MTHAARSLLTVADVTEQLKISRATVFELIKTGELRSIKIGQSRRIPTDAVQDYISNLCESQGAA